MTKATLEEAEQLGEDLASLVARILPGFQTTEPSVAVGLPGLACVRLWLLALIERRRAGFYELIGADLNSGGVQRGSSQHNGFGRPLREAQ